MTTTLPPDPWKALGVERNADKSEIRSAYKKLVLKCHPDKVQDPTLKALKQEEFQKVQQAYELLNNDAEKAKYEQKLQLAELQRAAAKVHQDAKNSPNTSVPRSSTRYATYDIRTAEPTSRYKSSPSGGKVYTHYTTTHTRSHEEMPSSRSYPLYEESDKAARKSAGYEKPSRRDEERRERDREERRRRREEEELSRLREKERDRERERDRDRERERERDRERERAEKEREARKAEKKRLEKEREKERRRDAEDKARRHKPYVEPYDAYVEELLFEDEKYVTSRSEKKRSSSRKHDEARERDRERDRDRDRERERERDKSSSRRAKSPHASSDQKLKHMEEFERAKLYMSSAGSSVPEKTAFWISQTPPDSYLTPPVPSPPPAVDLEEDSIRHAAARAAGRRSSNDPSRSREKLSYNLDATPRARPIPNLTKSYSTPPPAPESPPRVSRSQTVPHESYARPIPAPLQRGATWAAGGIDERHLATDYLDDYDSDDGRERRHRRSRRARSPSAQAISRYKVEGTKTSKLESQYSSSKLESPYLYGDSPSSTRRYAADVLDGHVARSPSSTYAGAPFKVKEAPIYGPDDVKYSEYAQPSYYSAARAPA